MIQISHLGALLTVPKAWQIMICPSYMLYLSVVSTQARGETSIDADAVGWTHEGEEEIYVCYIYFT